MCECNPGYNGDGLTCLGKKRYKKVGNKSVIILNCLKLFQTDASFSHPTKTLFVFNLVLLISFNTFWEWQSEDSRLMLLRGTAYYLFFSNEL